VETPQEPIAMVLAKREIGLYHLLNELTERAQYLRNVYEFYFEHIMAVAANSCFKPAEPGVLDKDMIHSEYH
jgi:hypothetical protein